MEDLFAERVGGDAEGAAAEEILETGPLEPFFIPMVWC